MGTTSTTVTANWTSVKDANGFPTVVSGTDATVFVNNSTGPFTGEAWSDVDLMDALPDGATITDLTFSVPVEVDGSRDSPLIAFGPTLQFIDKAEYLADDFLLGYGVFGVGGVGDLPDDNDPHTIDYENVAYHAVGGGGILDLDAFAAALSDVSTPVILQAQGPNGGATGTSITYSAPLTLTFHWESAELVLPCDTLVELDLSTAVFFTDGDGDPVGQYADGVIFGDGDLPPDFYFPGLVLDASKSYLINVTFDPDSPHDGGTVFNFVALFGVQPGNEQGNYDDGPEAFLYNTGLAPGVDHTQSFTVGSGLSRGGWDGDPDPDWDDPTSGVVAGFNSLWFETDTIGAVSAISITKICSPQPPSGLPSGQGIQLDDGTGTYPYDISGSIRWADQAAWTRGRDDETSDNQPGTLSMTLENVDGVFSFGDTTYSIAPDQGIRFSIEDTIRWTGRLQSIPVSWPGGGEEFSVVKAAATDALAVMARRALRGSADEELLTDTGAGAYYWLQEPSDATRASDVSPNDQPQLIPGSTGGLGAAMEFGFDMGARDGATGVLFTAGTLGVDGFVLQDVTGGTYSDSSIRVDFLIREQRAIVNPALAGSTQFVDVGAGGIVVTYDADSQDLSVSGTDITTVTGTVPGSFGLGDMALHAITVQADASSVDLWLDGTMLATGSGAVATFDNSTLTLCDPALTLFPGALPGGLAFSRLSIGPRVSDARVEAHHAAMLEDFSGETPTERITRVCIYAAVPTGTLDTGGSTILGPTQQDGRSALDVLLETAQADRGDGFADNEGLISYISGDTLEGLTTPDLVLDANAVDISTSIAVDMLGIVNDATGTTPATGNSYRKTDPTSIATHGVYPQSYTWNLSTDAQVKARTDWVIEHYAEPKPRVGQLVIDMLTMDVTTRADALTLGVGSYLQVTGMPAQTPGGTTLDLIVQGVAETLTAAAGQAEWTLSLNVVTNPAV